MKGQWERVIPSYVSKLDFKQSLFLYSGWTIQIFWLDYYSIIQIFRLEYIDILSIMINNHAV